MKLSARNQLPGTIVAIGPDAAVKVDIGGHVVTSSITEEAIAELGLAVGDR